MDLDTVLRVLDEEYLSSFARSERTVFPPLQAPVDGGVQRIEYEVASEAEEPAAPAWATALCWAATPTARRWWPPGCWPRCWPGTTNPRCAGRFCPASWPGT